MSVLYPKALGQKERAGPHDILRTERTTARSSASFPSLPSSPTAPLKESARAKQKGRDFVLSDLSKEVTLIRERLDELGGHL